MFLGLKTEAGTAAREAVRFTQRAGRPGLSRAGVEGQQGRAPGLGPVTLRTRGPGGTDRGRYDIYKGR